MTIRGPIGRASVIPRAGRGSARGCHRILDPRTAPVGNGVVGSGHWPGYFRVMPKAGEILIFPSTTRHWVHPHRAAEERVTIAFNARFSPIAAVRRKR